MVILSSAVSAGDDILASQYNNLRTDLLTGDIAIAGVKTFSSAPVLSEGASIAATKKLYLGAATYLIESASNTMDLATNNVVGIQILSNQNVDIPNGGIAPGGNEPLGWDVVSFSLDGTSPDTVTYVIDETTVRGVWVAIHRTATEVISQPDEGSSAQGTAFIDNDVMTITYGANYGASDAAEVIVFYVV